jgi:predicted Rdx family selenoprotein
MDRMDPVIVLMAPGGRSPTPTPSEGEGKETKETKKRTGLRKEQDLKQEVLFVMSHDRMLGHKQRCVAETAK